nr:reverse transcriptase domain-containing protein [Tanacetum cinerariifolium]
VYYVEGLNHNLFLVGQFCNADLEVAFWKSTCFVRHFQGNDLLTGNRGSNLYTILLQETTSSTLLCLMAKASPTQAWLWHRRLSHLNFDYINLLSKKDVVIGLPKRKYVKDQLCSSCESVFIGKWYVYLSTYQRSFLKTVRALIDVFDGELTLRVGEEAITFNLDQTSRYSANYSDLTAKTIDVIDMACEEYSQEVLVDELPVVELKALPPHLEYALLEGDDKLPVIIAKDLSVEEKSALLTVLKSHKRAIAWKLSDINGINLEFCIHKILMEEDFKPTVQHQRRVNPKIHDVIKIRRKPHSPAYMERFLIAACLLGYAMLQARFREKMLKRYEDTNLCLNWEKSHFMVKEEGVYLARKPLISLRLATLDQQEVTIDQITQPERCLIQGFIGLPYIVMPNLVKNCDVRQRQKHKAYWALKHANFDLKTAGDHRNVQIYELNELRDQAYKNSLIYKEKTKTLHDSKIKNRVFNIGDRVLLFNSRLNIFSSKLKSRWSDSFTISQVYPYGTVELSQPDGPNFKVNGHRIKHYFGEDIPKLVVPDLQTFAKDH